MALVAFCGKCPQYGLPDIFSDGIHTDFACNKIPIPIRNVNSDLRFKNF